MKTKEEIEKKIYNGYAFEENEYEKALINRDIYDELKRKYKIYKCPGNNSLSETIFVNPTDDEINNNDIVYSHNSCYHHGVYKIHKKPEEITDEELLLIFDRGSLCFGGRIKNTYIYTVDED